MTHCWEKRLTSVSSTFAWTRRERDSSLRDAAEAWTLPAENKISNQYSNLHLKKLEGKEKTYPEQAEGWIQKEQTSVKVKTEKHREKWKKPNTGSVIRPTEQWTSASLAEKGRNRGHKVTVSGTRGFPYGSCRQARTGLRAQPHTRDLDKSYEMHRFYNLAQFSQDNDVARVVLRLVKTLRCSLKTSHNRDIQA